MAGTLVLQLPPELAPRGVVYSPREVVVLSHISAAQVFHSDNVVVPHKLGRRLVQTVAASVCDVPVDTRHPELLLLTVVGALLLTRELTLLPLKLPELRLVMLLVGDTRPVRCAL